MKLFDDDFAQFEGGALDGLRIFLHDTNNQHSLMAEWPPPEEVTLSMRGEPQSTYERISHSAITDEQREEMTHVCRGALYRLKVT